MIKKYYSTDEFYYVDPLTKVQEAYTGYVTIKDGKPYRYSDNAELVVGNNYCSKVNLTDEYFDRLLINKLELPRSEAECTFAPNDFLKATVINRIISNLEENNAYIFKNCFVPQNDLPANRNITALSPYRMFTTYADGDFDKSDYVGVSDWFWSNISYNNIQNIWDKTDWPNSVFGYDWLTDDVIDATMTITNKTVDGSEATSDEDNLFAIFLLYPTKIHLMNLYLFPNSRVSEITDPMKTLEKNEDILAEAADRKFKAYSPANNQTEDDPNTNHNLNLLTFDKIDPNNNKSANFKALSSLALDGDHLYAVDSELHALFRYDVSRCLADRGAATNHIMLVDQLQGKGDLNTPYEFDTPISVAVHDNVIAVLDSGNTCVKVMDQYFNHLFTIRSGAFVRQKPRAVQICPYEFKFNGVLVKEGSIWVLSESGDKISIDVYSNDNKYLGSKTIKYIELIDEIWYSDEDGMPSSNNPVHSREYLKKIEFSYNNSNYFYIVSDRRLLKFQISTLDDPLGVVEYYKRSITLDDLTWKGTYQPWYCVQDTSNELVTWDYDADKAKVEFPKNKAFCVSGAPGIETDVIFNLIDNRTYFSDGDIQRVNNNEESKKIFIDNITKEMTYDQYDANNKKNKGVYVAVGSTVKKCKTLTKQVYNELKEKMVDWEYPVEIEDTYEAQPYYYTLGKMRNCIIFFKEPNDILSSLLRTDIEVYNDEEVNFKTNDEYYSSLSYNKMLHKIYFNLLQIRKYILGQFVGGYNVDGILTYDHTNSDSTIQNLATDSENFYMGENEQTSIVLNRAFKNIYTTQVNILDKMQAKYVSSLNYNINSYKII
jgi:hypothetical protein